MLSPKQVGKAALIDNLDAGGVISVAGNIEQYRALSVSQTTAAQSLELPNPADTSLLVGIDVINSGSVSFELSGVEVQPGQFLRNMWNGLEWIPAVTGEAIVSDGIEGFKSPVDVKYDFTGGFTPGVPELPTEPATPTFAGTVHTVTDEAEFDLALANAVDGDIVEVPADTTITLTGQKTINKSICLRGQDKDTSRITSSFNVLANQALIRIAGTKADNVTQNNDVYIHTLTIESTSNVNDHAVIGVTTVSPLFNNGSSGIRLEDLKLFTTEFCVWIGANEWVVKNCEFNYTPPTGAADTARHVYIYNSGTMGWLEGCVFNCTTEVPARTIGVLLTSVDYEFAPVVKTSGFSGDLVMKGNSQGSGNLRQWLVMDSFRTNGVKTDPMQENALSFWVINNSHNESAAGSFNLFSGAGVSPLNFFNIMYFAGNNCAARSAGTQKGLIAVDGSGTIRSAGKPLNFYVPLSSVNTGTAMTTALEGAYVKGCTDTIDGTVVSPEQGNLLAINSTIYNSPSPADLVELESPVSGGPIVLSGTFEVDGFSLTGGERVLVVDASEALNSGIYVSSESEWERAADFASGSSVHSSLVFVNRGDEYASTAWLCTNQRGSDVVGTDELSFVQFGESSSLTGDLDMQGSKIVNLADGTDAQDAVTLSQLTALQDVQYDQEVFVAKSGSDLTGTGSLLNPFASINAALASISDAAPAKRYAIRVQSGSYVESSAIALKPDVYIVGTNTYSVRIQAASFELDPSFTGGGDKRSGIMNAIVVGACSFDMDSVTSTDGKLFFQHVSFSNALTLNGHTTINQAFFDCCTFFGTLTFSGFNVGTFSNNRCFTSIVLNQSPLAIATVLNATGGFADSLTATAAVNNFNRRCSVFARGLKFDGTVTVDGPSAYFDYTVGSLPTNGATVVNGGNLVSVDFGANKALSNLVFPTAVNNPIIPANTSATNFGDWGKQWFWSFAYLHASTGTDCYLVSYPSSFGAESSEGKNVYVFADAAGLAPDISGGAVGLFTNNASGSGASGGMTLQTGDSADGNSGTITLETGAPSGSGTRGIIELDGRLIDVKSAKLINLADGTDPADAVNKGQLDAAISGAVANRLGNYSTFEGTEWTPIVSTYVNWDQSSFVGTYSDWENPNIVNPNVIRNFALEAGKTYEIYVHIPLIRATNTGQQFRMYLVQFLDPAGTEVEFANRLTKAVAVVNGVNGTQYNATLRTIYRPVVDINVAVYSSVTGAGLEINTLHPSQLIIQEIP